MAANLTIPNDFVTAAPSVADDVDANFNAVASWVNTNAVHLDASKAFTAVPSGPTGTNPTSDDQLTRKGYVDGLVDRVDGSWLVTGSSHANSGDTNVTFTSEISDTASLAAVPWSTFTVPSAGMYAITVYADSLTVANWNNTWFNPRVVAGAYTAPILGANDGAQNYACASMVVPIAAAGTIRVIVNNTGAGAITMACRISICRIPGI